MKLADLPLHQPAAVRNVDTAAVAAPEDWAAHLTNLGFLPGEPVVVTARGWPGADPLVVRVGASTYALRRAEAACVRVTPHTATAAG